MKWRILISTIFFPLIAVFVLGYVLYSPRGPFILYVAALTLIIAVARIFLSDWKYLIELSVTESYVQVHYYNRFLRKKLINIPLSQMKDVELNKVNWLPHYPATLNIKTEKDWLSFLIVQRKQYQDLQTKLTGLSRVANI